MRIAFPEGDVESILRAASHVIEEKIGVPVLLGDESQIRSKAEELTININGAEIFNPDSHPRFDEYALKLFEQRCRKGMTLKEATRLMHRKYYFGLMMLMMNEVDAVVNGHTVYYPQAIKPALQIIPLAEGMKVVSGMHLLMFKKEIIFCADTTVNINPDAETLAEIAICTADAAKRFDVEPRIAMLSFSNFGSVRHPNCEAVSDAVKLVKERRPELIIDGEMQANTAFDMLIMKKRYPFSRLQERANVLIFPSLEVGNIAAKLLIDLGGAEAIGPILIGLEKPYHVLERDCSVDNIVNMAAIASVQAQQTI